MLGLLGCEQSHFYFLSHLDREQACEWRIRCARVLSGCLWCYREHTPSSPIHLPSTRPHVSCSYFMGLTKGKLSSFLPDFFRCIIVTALPREKASKEQTKYQIRYMKKEKDKEKKWKRRKRKKRKRGEKKTAHIVPFPPDPFSTLPSLVVARKRKEEVGGSVWKNGSNDCWNFFNVKEV